MRELEENVIVKFIIVAFIIIPMLFSNILPIISMAVETVNDQVEDNVNDDEYVKFNLTWSSDATEVITDKNSELDVPVTAYFKLEFNTIKEGFKNFKIVVTNEKGTTIDLSKNVLGNDAPFSRYQNNTLYLQDTTSAGTIITGNIRIYFL